MCQGQSRTFKKIAFLELFLRTIEEDKWNLFEKLGQLRTPTLQKIKFKLSVLYRKYTWSSTQIGPVKEAINESYFMAFLMFGLSCNR